MNSHKYLFLEKYSRVGSIVGIFTFAFLIIGLITDDAHANFATTESSAVAACPANHKMYYIGANPPNSTQIFPVANPPQELSWTSGSTTKTFTFEENSGNKTFTISFAGILDKNNTEGNTPFYGSINGSTSSALNLVHNSTSTINNHTLNISINRSISKAGYKIQDVDSLTSNVIIGYFGFFPIYGNRTPYAEQVDVSTNGGRLTSNSLFHTANNPTPNTSVVTAIQGQNCSTGECDIDAYWGYKAANSVLGLRHNNTLNETSAPHAVGYSDFYFCLAPPKLIVKKALNSTRVKTNDQFEIVVSGGSIATNSFTTTGTGSTITNGTSTTLSLAENNIYTVTERAMNGTTLGEIANYNATYTCSNATTGSTTVMPTTAMSYNPTTKTRSFTLSNVTYGDEITCTITNSANYVFSGTVFNDNGNVLNPSKDDISSKYLNNSLYFNGRYDSPTESGIPFTTGHTITLNKCAGDSGTFSPQTVNINSDGTYSFNLISAQVGSYTRLCVTQNEPSNYTYSVDTTSDVRQINIINSQYNYPSNDFGDVIQENAALVLIKSQYIHDCSLNNLATIGVNYEGSASSAYSIKPISGIVPGQCIAYRIEAINRGNVSLTDIVIKDKLQSKNDSNNSLITSTLVNPIPIGENSGTPSFATNSVSIGNNGTVITNTFSLGATTATRRQAIRFNTKYGTTISN
ncbi:hypothetical protein PQI08_04820 [Psychrobacter pacificensis]|uniref:hypothetical protein n=1 Tax=Psychrobacter pacificensis TaxID=112002 RepID=UPI002595C948|nr:hypothetical protein [uncultured Psychrobacter sp.]